MEKLTITGVPEHFNYPWLSVVESQPFLNQGIELVWKNEPRGSGAMNMALRKEETDIAIILTESFVKDKIEGNPGLIIGMHVRSPLIWGIHTPGALPSNETERLTQAPFLISRPGSGSHLMAYVLAKREGWNLKDLKFEIVGDLHGALESATSSKASLFLWEKFTTKPYVDRGLLKNVGEVPTPWPCFAIVAHENAVGKFVGIIEDLRDLVYRKAADLRKEGNLAEQISNTYGIHLNDVKDWLCKTEWAEENRVMADDILKTQDILFELNLIDKKIDAISFISQQLVELVDS